MLKKIDVGKTHLSNLHEVFKVSEEELENKRARLFPSGNTDNEVHTTSIFLASLCAVKEYREEVLLSINAKKIKTRNVQLHAYTEINSLSKESRPDALLVITSGKASPVIEWIAFIEFKVSKNIIDQTQIDKYISFGKEIGIDTIVTISNQLVTSPSESPVKTRKSFNLYHWSWAYLKVTASRMIRSSSVEDADHVYILSEFRRYLDNHKNIDHFNTMGKNWKESVSRIHLYQESQTIESDLLEIIVNAFQQEEKDITLQLTDSTDSHIELIPKKGKGDRKSKIEEMLNKNKVITSDFYLDKDLNKTFSIDIDFTRQVVSCYTYIKISGGKAQAQTSRLINNFEDNSGYTDSILVNAFYIRNKCLKNDVALSSLIDQKEDSLYYSILEKKFGDEVKFFELRTNDALRRDFQNPKNFIIKLEAIANRFVKQVMQVIH